MASPIRQDDLLTCAAGSTPAALKASDRGQSLDGAAVATVKDYQANKHILPMGICKLLTAKAGGTPTACQPQPQGWQGPSCGLTLDGDAVLTDQHKCTCSEGGVIEVKPAGSRSVELA